MKTTRIAYWIFTLLLVLPMALSGIMDLTGATKISQTMQHLGYPLYIMKFFGVAYLLGAAAILYDRAPRLKEWAYAGFTINFLGAAYSHYSSGDAPTIAVIPLVVLLFLVVSYRCWSRMREESELVVPSPQFTRSAYAH